MVRRLPATTQAVYSELLERSIHFEAGNILGTAASGSFVDKRVRGRRYWYLQKSLGSTKRQLYLGPDSETLRTWMARVAEERALTRQDRAEMVRLGSMLVSGGLAAESEGVVKVLEIVREAEVFRLGGVLIGTVAYRALGAALGVMLEGAAVRTQDVDIAQEPALAIGLTPDRTRGTVAERLLGSEEGVRPISTLDPRTPSTSFSVRSRDLRVDFLVPARGSEKEAMVFLPAFGLSAAPLRFLEYLIESPIQAVVVGPRPVLVNAPQPARFALHMIYTSLARSATFQTKATKDLAQASSLIEVLAEDRPADIVEAWSALGGYPRVRKRIAATIPRLSTAAVAGLERLLPLN